MRDEHRQWSLPEDEKGLSCLFPLLAERMRLVSQSDHYPEYL
jgi:hypothetical protein